MLQTISEDIATYFSFRSLFSADNQNRNEWTDKFQDAITLLDEIREGDVDLVDSSGNVISEREATTTDGLVDSNTIDTQSFFDVDDPMDWKFDDDMLDTVEGKR
jgi:ADP-ribosylglycohydrolase